MSKHDSKMVRRERLIPVNDRDLGMTLASGVDDTSCPTCRTDLISEYGARPWCPRCEWGLDVYEPRPGTSRLGRWAGAIAFRVAYRLTVSQFRALVGRSPSRPGWTGARVVVAVVSVAFYILVAAIVGVGGWLVFHDFPHASILLGVLLLGLAAVLVPRFGRIDSSGEILSRDEAPGLHALVDRVAATTGVPAPHSIAVTFDCAAGSTSVGIRRRRVLVLGLGLFGALPPQQRVALIAHQLAHFGNGDVRRSGLTQPALATLGQLSSVFQSPAGGWTALRDPLTARAPYSLAAMEVVSLRRPSGFGERVTGLVSQVLAAGFAAVHMVVSAAVLRDTQRAEYFADQRTAGLAGTRSTVALLDLLISGPVVATCIANSARAGETQPGWRAAVAALTDRQSPRLTSLRQLSMRRETALFATHPPSGLRSQMVERAGWRDPALVLVDGESDRIDTELSGRYQRCRRDLATSGA